MQNTFLLPSPFYPQKKITTPMRRINADVFSDACLLVSQGILGRTLPRPGVSDAHR